MPTRRNFLAAAAALPLVRGLDADSTPTAPSPAPTAQTPRMQLAMHQNTSRAAGFRGSLEGWSRAGIRYVELNDGMMDRFLEGDTLAGAASLLRDLDLTPVSAVATLQDIWLPGPARAQSLETWRRRCEQYATLGLERIYAPSLTNREVTVEEWAATPECIREAGEIARQSELVAMIEFTRTSTHLSTLTSSLQVIREAAHPNVRPMLDFFHFWSGLSKFEDLDMLRPGELVHAHFQDLLDAPRERTDNNYRLIPGDGIAPVVPIIRKLADKGYAGALSVELFRQEFVNGDPFEVGTEIRTKCERVMREAGAL
ncbi:MAG: sugar phosphate isomerase/epimerase [Gemmatimonadetes bacterium]|nr:sugar phosphate isomerase/epimerase [Gemmatimonadota bacterium]